MCVAVGALYFEYAVADFEHADVECTTTKVEHENCFVFTAFVEPVCERCCGRLVDDPQNFETGDLPCFFCRSALRVIKICRHGDDCLRHRSAQVGLGVSLEFHQSARTDFLWRVFLAVNIGGCPIRTHVSLDAAKCSLSVCDRLTLGNFANENVSAF